MEIRATAVKLGPLLRISSAPSSGAPLGLLKIRLIDELWAPKRSVAVAMPLGLASSILPSSRCPTCATSQPGRLQDLGRNSEAFGAFLANLAHLLGLPVAQKVGSASRSERAQSSAGSRLARGRGHLRLVKDELIEINRDRVY